MKRWLSVFSTLLCLLVGAANVSAQQPYTGPLQIRQVNPNKIYANDHPNLLQYDDPSKWPCFDSQGHWGGEGVNPMFNLDPSSDRHIITPDGFPVTVEGVERLMLDMPTHAHQGICFPLGAIIPAGTTLRIPFHTQTRMLDGIRGGLNFTQNGDSYLNAGGLFIQQVVLNGQSAPLIGALIATGDPVGLVKVDGFVDVTFGPSTNTPAKGWSIFQMEDVMVFPGTKQYNTVPFNGGVGAPDTNMDIMRIAYYAVNDPAAPDTSLDVDVQMLRMESRPTTFNNPNITASEFGGTFVILQQFPPLGPLATPKTLDVYVSGYGGSLTKPAEVLTLRNNDFHNNVFGILDGDVFTNLTNAHDSNTTVTIDPALICATTPPAPLKPGQERRTFIAKQDDGGGELSTSLISMTITAADCTGQQQLVAVPFVVGLDLQTAQTIVSMVGLNTTTVSKDDPAPAGTVLDQQPVAETQVLVGSTVQLTVSTGVVHHVVGSIPLPVTASEETIDGVPDGKVTICAGTICKPF